MERSFSEALKILLNPNFFHTIFARDFLYVHVSNGLAARVATQTK